MKASAGIAVLIFASPLAAQQRTITCSSTNGQQQVCGAPTRDGVLLVREMSDNVCRQGETWSYDRRSITVSGGCSASFMVSGRRGGAENDGYSNNAYGGSSYGNDNQRRDANGNQRRDGDTNRSDQMTQANGRAILPRGLQVPIRLEQTTRLAELVQGQVVAGVLSSDLVVNGQTVAQANASARMKVFSQNGAPLDLRLESLEIRGNVYTLQSNSVTMGENAEANRGVGGFLNALAGGDALRAGSVITFVLARDSR